MPEPKTVTANQLVAYNLARIRKMQGLSQDEARELLKPQGINWSKAVYSAAERSYDGARIRQFEADHLLAFSRAFGVPVLYFFLPPKPEDRVIGKDGKTEVTSASVGGIDVSWADVLDAMLAGRNRLSMVLRVLELPREERHTADSYLSAILNQPHSLEEFAGMKAQLAEGEQQ